MSIFYHATSRTNALQILAQGFEGGWGDAGFGVYTFDRLSAAEAYIADGGWDGELVDPVILQVTADEAELDYIDCDPAWPNPEDYDAVRWHPMDPDVQGARWQPEIQMLDV